MLIVSTNKRPKKHRRHPHRLSTHENSSLNRSLEESPESKRISTRRAEFFTHNIHPNSTQINNVYAESNYSIINRICQKEGQRRKLFSKPLGYRQKFHIHPAIFNKTMTEEMDEDLGSPSIIQIDKSNWESSDLYDKLRNSLIGCQGSIDSVGLENKIYRRNTYFSSLVTPRPGEKCFKYSPATSPNKGNGKHKRKGNTSSSRNNIRRLPLINSRGNNPLYLKKDGFNERDSTTDLALKEANSHPHDGEFLTPGSLAFVPNRTTDTFAFRTERQSPPGTTQSNISGGHNYPIKNDARNIYRLSPRRNLNNLNESGGEIKVQSSLSIRKQRSPIGTPHSMMSGELIQGFTRNPHTPSDKSGVGQSNRLMVKSTCSRHKMNHKQINHMYKPMHLPSVQRREDIKYTSSVANENSLTNVNSPSLLAPIGENLHSYSRNYESRDLSPGSSVGTILLEAVKRKNLIISNKLKKSYC